MFKIQSDWADLRESPIDIFEIEMNTRDFYLILNDSFGNIVENLYKLRGFVNSAKDLLRNHIMPEENQYIENHKKSFFWLLDNIGRVEKSIKSMQDQLLKSSSNRIMLKSDIINSTLRFSESPEVFFYIETLARVLESLVYHPIKNALKKFKNFPEQDNEGNKIIKDKELFCWFLFLELYHFSESLGSITAEETKSYPKQQIISPSQSSKERNFEYEEELPEIPENLKIEKNEKEDRFKDKLRMLVDSMDDDYEEEEDEDEDKEFI